jgi:hypothetical protein
MSYKNKGPLDPTDKNYLVVNGARVYTGEKFDASEEDVKGLSKRFDIQSYKTDHEDVVSTPKDEVLKVAETPVEDEFQFQTEEDALDSASKSTKSEKGVK